MNLNERILKVTGSAPIEGELEIGKNYAVGVEFSITNEDKRNNEDGTFDIVYKAKLVRAQVHTETGVVRTKDTRSQSTKTRSMILAVKDEFKPEMDEESFYNLIQGGIRHNLRDIIHTILQNN